MNSFQHHRIINVLRFNCFLEYPFLACRPKLNMYSADTFLYLLTLLSKVDDYGYASQPKSSKSPSVRTRGEDLVCWGKWMSKMLRSWRALALRVIWRRWSNCWINGKNLITSEVESSLDERNFPFPFN